MTGRSRGARGKGVGGRGRGRGGGDGKGKQQRGAGKYVMYCMCVACLVGVLGRWFVLCLYLQEHMVYMHAHTITHIKIIVMTIIIIIYTGTPTSHHSLMMKQKVPMMGTMMMMNMVKIKGRMRVLNQVL